MGGTEDTGASIGGQVRRSLDSRTGYQPITALDKNTDPESEAVNQNYAGNTYDRLPGAGLGAAISMYCSL